MSTGKTFTAFAFTFMLLPALGYAQIATCTGWKTFKVSNKVNTSANGINKRGTVGGGTVGAFQSTSPAPAFTRYSNGAISTFVYQNHATLPFGDEIRKESR